MHGRQRIGLALGVVAAVICGGHILLSIAYVGETPILASWRDQPFVNLAGVLAGAAAMYLVWFGADNGFFPSRRSAPEGLTSPDMQVRAGIYLNALTTAFLLVVTSLIVGVVDQLFSRELTISWIADGALWALQGLYWLLFGLKAEARPGRG